MNTINRIAVIGATGKLAIPVIKELVKHFQVRAIVRNTKKAQQVLPSEVEIVHGDLKDLASLERGLANQDAVYINLSTETTDMTLDFYEEREGISNIMKAAKQNNLKHISKIGALGAYPLATHLQGENIVPNIIRIQGHKTIEASGIPYTIFAPTFFMDLFLFINDGKAIQWIGSTTKQKLRWISSDDYAKAVVAAIQQPSTWNKHYPIQGAEAIDPKTAMKRFIAVYDPKLKIKSFPVWMIRIMGFFSPHMKFLAHLFAYFERQPDPLYAENTWKELGAPTISIEEFARSHQQQVLEVR